ncbi:CHC2 zinc finger domain-containing protein [Streptomyces sp. NPDC056638]|uniref:CHC2 zinc finger domain-containing protein n=1 Tax=Streptomyces sp. NPDC056638 TaxID=3345887 RepID=UPI0036B9A753
MAPESRSEKPSIADVLAHFYGLKVNKQRRGWQKFCCPLHADSSPSASVNAETDRWSCFVCNLSEDSYAVIMRELNCGFLEAKEFAHSKFSRSSEDVPLNVSGEPGRGVRNGSGAGRQRKRTVRPGLRPFGSAWS